MDWHTGLRANHLPDSGIRWATRKLNAEYAVVKNYSGAPYNLVGWTLRSATACLRIPWTTNGSGVAVNRWLT